MGKHRLLPPYPVIGLRSFVTKIKGTENWIPTPKTKSSWQCDLSFPFKIPHCDYHRKPRTNIRGKLRAVRLFNKRDYRRYSLGERDLLCGTKAIRIDTGHASGEYEMLINCPSYIMYVINVIRGRCFAFMACNTSHYDLQHGNNVSKSFRIFHCRGWFTVNEKEFDTKYFHQ